MAYLSSSGWSFSPRFGDPWRKHGVEVASCPFTKQFRKLADTNRGLDANPTTVPTVRCFPPARNPSERITSSLGPSLMSALYVYLPDTGLGQPGSEPDLRLALPNGTITVVGGDVAFEGHRSSSSRPALPYSFARARRPVGLSGLSASIHS